MFDLFIPFCVLCWFNLIVLLCFSIHLFKITNFQLTFLNCTTTSKLIVNDEDDYYKTFNEIDFKVRNVSNTSEYKSKIKNSTTEFSLKEKIKVYLCVTLIQNSYVLKKYFDKKFNDLKIIDKIMNIPWKFGLIKNTTYENGLPHTRLDTILISREHLSNLSISKLMKLFIHEKVHTFQKLYPRITKKIINQQGFKNTVLKSQFNSQNHKKIRANPDIDEYVYKDKNNKLLLATYTKNPSKISDIEYSLHRNNNQSSEHPYEKMAIEISDLF